MEFPAPILARRKTPPGKFSAAINLTETSPANSATPIWAKRPYHLRGSVAPALEPMASKLTGVGSLPVNQQLSVYGRLGFFLWNVDFKDGTGLFGGSASASGMGLTL